MLYGWVFFIGFAVAYTWIALRLPLGDDFPPIWSSDNTMPRERIVLIHSLFLAAYLGVLWYLTWRESSFGWLFRGPVIRHPGAFYLIVVAIFTAMIERLWLYRGQERKSCPDENDTTKEI
jgi:hypothetical protein